jgi:hypothetical protein
MKKNKSSNVVIYIDKQFRGSSKKHVKCNWYHIVLQNGGWFDGKNIGVKPRRLRFNPLYQHILCRICIFVYTTCTCV